MTIAPVLVVIVNYRTAADTAEMLASLAPEMCAMPTAHAVVVDNGSADGSAEALAELIVSKAYSDWCSLLPLTENRGFSAGNNAALAYANELKLDYDLIWLVNPDTVVLPGALATLTQFMSGNPEAGIVGGSCLDRNGKRQHSAFRFPTALGEVDAALGLGVARRLLRDFVIAPDHQDFAGRVDWVSGANMMVRRSTIEKTGPFDEGYFLYYEETDLCRRAANLGIACWHEPASRIIHLIGRSTGLVEHARPTARRPRYWFVSRSRYYRRHLGRAALFAATLCWLFSFPIGRLADALRGRPYLEAPGLWFDMLSFGWGSAKDAGGGLPRR